MSDFVSLTHFRRDCKYHVIFIPMYCKKKLFGKVRRYLRSVFHELARQKESKIVEGHMMIDNVHMCILISPKYSVAQVIGYIKGQSAIAIAWQFGGRKWNFNGESLWARGYSVSTVGFELEEIRRYIRDQNKRDQQEDEGDF